MRLWRALLLPVLAVLTAEIVLRSAFADSDVLAPPSAVLRGGLEIILDGTILRSTRDTLLAAGGGLLLGGLPGFLFGVCLGRSRFVSRISFLSVEVLRPVPAVALIPLAMLVFGFGFGMEMSIVGFATFWPAMILTKHAIEEIPAVLVDAGRSLCLSRVRTLASIILPAAAPRLFSGLRFCVGYSVVVAVTVEIFSNPQGLGYTMMISQQTLHPDLMLAVLVWVGVVGWALNACLLSFQRSLFANRTTGAGQ